MATYIAGEYLGALLDHAAGAGLQPAEIVAPALSLGEDIAHSLGFGARSLPWRVMGGVAVGVGAAVAISGSIAFVGLVVPHLLRPFVANRPGQLLLPSALGGALLVLMADILVQSLPGDTELKLGVVTALLGAPFFLAIVIGSRSRIA